MQERKRKKKSGYIKSSYSKLTRPVRAPSQILKFDKDSNN